jgi:hypothetical protein
VLGKAERVGERRPEQVRDLGRGPHGELAGARVEVGQHGPRLHGHAGVAVGAEVPGDLYGGLSEDGVDVARREGRIDVDVVAPLLVEHGCAIFHGLARVDDRRQRLVLDLHALQRVLGDGPTLRGQHRHGLALEADAVGRQARQLTDLEGGDAQAGSERRRQGARVLARQHRADAGQAQGLARVDAEESRVRVRTPQEGRLQLSWQADVANVAALPAQQPSVVDPPNSPMHRDLS